MIRVRFAPSPTGYLHVGGLRTALYNYLFARKNNGTFILRIEDTDQARYVPDAEQKLIDIIRWSGLTYDEGPDIGGPKAPYRQSERTDIYRRYAQQLLDAGKAYYAFDTPEELELMRREQEKLGLPTKYDRRALKLSPEEVWAKLDSGIPHVIRMKVPESETIRFTDIVRGEVEFSSDQLDDQVLIKSDGFPTYHLANVVDDHLMEISHVIRGEEWLPSTPKHVLLYRYFGWEPPQFAHLPLLLNPDKSKLSKRQGDVAVEDYRSKGYLPEALINFVALLGWNPGDEREIFTLDELVKEFSLERVGKSGAVFNVEKLTWMNAEHLRRKPAGEILSLLKQELAQSRFSNHSLSDDYLLNVIEAMRERIVFVRDIIEKSPYFFEPPDSYDPETVRKRWKPESREHLLHLRDAFEKLQNPTKEQYEAALSECAHSLGVSKGQLIHPLRLAVSGMGAGPGVFDILVIIGKEETIRRITTAVSKLP
ncbi:MAG TPA: glutamate--tRNA ligase [Bacteroidota bacterium]|nr:glutamate--tRNA ligase [Bacteroidota bacterium]